MKGKFRMLLDSPAGDHLSNALGPFEALAAAGHVHLLTGNRPELLPDTRTLRKELADVDARAEERLAAAPPIAGVVPLAIAWNKPLTIEAGASCNCPKCRALKAAAMAASQFIEKPKSPPPIDENPEHPYFAIPVLKPGTALEYEDDAAPETTLPAAVRTPRRLLATSVGAIVGLVLAAVWELARWFFGKEPGL